MQTKPEEIPNCNCEDICQRDDIKCIVPSFQLFMGIEHDREENECQLLYIGQMKDDKPHGYGKTLVIDGADKSLQFVGHWKDGHKHGMGKTTETNGDTWEGFFNQIDGHNDFKGNFTKINGFKTEGLMIGEHWEGETKFTYPDGSIVNRLFIDGKAQKSYKTEKLEPEK